MTLDDYDLFPAPDDREPARCRSHRWAMSGDAGMGFVWACRRCGKVRDETAVRRGRNNRSRGNAIERAVGKELGLRRVGQYGGPDDLAGALFAAQVKSGGAFSERYWSWLKAVPVSAGQTPILVVTDAPGPGHKRRALVVLELADWRALHGDDAA